MATSPDFVRLASSATRPLTDAAFDALREAVLVVDARLPHLPLVLANATARRCFLGENGIASLLESSLYSLLGPSTDPAIQAALDVHATEKGCANRVLPWRLPRGEVPVPTELRVLAAGQAQRMVMLTFAEPSSEPGLFSAVEQLPLDLLILDEEFTVRYANAGALRTAGEAKGAILGHSGLTLMPAAAIPREAFERVLEGHHCHDDAVAVTVPGAPTRWFEVDIQPLKDEAGIMGLVILSMEVTERRLRKRAPTETERRLLALTEHARDIITVAGLDGALRLVSGGIRNSLGYTAEERRSSSIFDLIHPEDVGPVRAKYGQLAGGAINRFSHQFRARHKDGSYRWLESNYESAFGNPFIGGVVVSSRDITERKQTEYQLARREEVFRLAAEAVNGIIFEWDLTRGVVHRSRGVQEVLGMKPDDLSPPGTWSARIHPQDDPAYNRQIAAALRSGNGWTTTYRIRDARGSYRSMLERGLIQRGADGNPVRAIGCCVDVSEIKRLTDLLAETQRTAKMGGWEYSYATHELTWTDEMFSIYETTPKDFVVSWESMLVQCTPESRQRFSDACAAAETADGGFDMELEITTLRNHPLWVRIVGHVEKMDGRPFRAFGSVQNIQSQKLAQIALSNSTGWLKLSMNMAHMHAWRWDLAADVLEFAVADEQMLNLPRAFPSMKHLVGRVHPKDRLAVWRAIGRAFQTRSEVQAEFRLPSRSGPCRSFAAVARPLFDAAGQPSGLVGVTQDVTARRESEARLRRSEELLRATTANTADTLILVDTNLRIRFINRPVGGMSIEDVIDRDFAALLPESARDSVIAKLRQVLASTEAANFEFDVTPDGADTQYFETRAVLVRDGGIGTGISITVRDITERKRLEQEILDVSSRERQTIGRDLHDGLGQELTGVALMLRGLATRLQKQSPECVGQVNEIVALVNQSIETTRSLARGLLPVNTESGGLSFALRALCERNHDLYGMEVDFQEEVWSHVGLSEASANHLYRIAQEALTNTARHARASAAAIYLRLTNSQFFLQIADNGTGIADTGRSRLGMGLKIMSYRAGMIGAKFELVPNYPHGTVVRVTGEQSTAVSGAGSVHSI